MNANLILLGRVLLSIIFILSGFGKLAGAAGFSGYLSSLGVPAPLVMAYVVGAFELLAGIAVLVGFQTRAVAIGPSQPFAKGRLDHRRHQAAGWFHRAPVNQNQMLRHVRAPHASAAWSRYSGLCPRTTAA